MLSLFSIFNQTSNNFLRYSVLYDIFPSDHHQDNGTIDDPCVTKTIEPVGSCCTLVAEKIYNHTEELFSEYPISELLLSAILVDTVNLKQGIGRTTEKDCEFAEDLEEYSTVAGKELFDIANKGL